MPLLTFWEVIQMGTDSESLDHDTRQTFFTDIQIFVSIQYTSAVKVGVLHNIYCYGYMYCTK